MTAADVLPLVRERLTEDMDEDKILALVNNVDEIFRLELCPSHPTFTPTESYLSLPKCFADVYVYYVLCKSDELLGDMKKLEYDQKFFISNYSDAADWVNRYFLPVGAEVIL